MSNLLNTSQWHSKKKLLAKHSLQVTELCYGVKGPYSTLHCTAPSQRFYQPDQTTAGTISHQTSTGDVSSDVHLLSPSRLILNDDGLDHPCRDHLYDQQMKPAISTYNIHTHTHNHLMAFGPGQPG